MKSVWLGSAALAILAAPFVAMERAEAACTATTPTVIDCTGTTTNSPNGFGTGTETGLTINVQPGATVSGTQSGVVLDDGTVNNLGTIQGNGSGGAGILVNNNLTLQNSGTITNQSTTSGFGLAIVGNANITNSGTISGRFGISAHGATINNSGLIQGTGAAAPAITIGGGSGNIVNSGTISGVTGIVTANSQGSTITNSGTITGFSGVAIVMSSAADTLTLNPGSRINGKIDMGGGADVININFALPGATITGGGPSRLVSSASAFDLTNIVNFTGTINALGGVGGVTVSGNQPFAQSGGLTATLDPTALGRADRVLMDFTGNVSSLVQSRLGGTAAAVTPVQVVSFAPTGASGRSNEAFAAMSAMAYGPERDKIAARAYPYADAPYNVWTSSFGAAGTQRGDDLMLRSNASAWAGIVGIDRQVRPDLLIGAFAGGGGGRLSVDQNSQSIDTEYFTGGLYSRFDQASYFLDLTLQAGASSNKSNRLVLNDTALSGSETATASYNGWYINPEIAYGRRYAFGNGYTLTPAARVRYLAGSFDGYAEANSAQNLVVGRRTLQDVEERAELELSKITGIAVGAFRTSVHGGMIALQRLGSPTVNTVLIGQNLSFTAPGKDSAVGAVAGVGIDLRASEHIALFGAFEGTLMSDKTSTAVAKGGLRVTF